jgi:hypothetical protein
MPLEQIKDYTKDMPCQHPEHNPPNCIALQPGEYRYTCPGCGKETVFTVPLITC